MDLAAESPNSLAIVTGGSRGLGFEVAKALVAIGRRVVIVSKDPDRAAATIPWAGGWRDPDTAQRAGERRRNRGS